MQARNWHISDACRPICIICHRKIKNLLVADRVSAKLALLSLDHNLWVKAWGRQLPAASKRDLAIAVATGACCFGDIDIDIAPHLGYCRTSRAASCANFYT